jgi:aspergillopepsin I
MTTVTFSSGPYNLVIDTGSSDTWVATSAFNCVSMSGAALPQSQCGFGPLYNVTNSTSFSSISGNGFQVRYTDGEFLTGTMGSEDLSLGGLSVRQIVGVVDRGWWMGDGISSGLLGMAYPALASNVQALNYTSVIHTL